MKSKKNKTAKRDQASYKLARKRSDKLEAYKYDSKPAVLQSANVGDAKENLADTTLRRLMSGNVFRSNKESVKKTNSNKRRYA